MARIVPGPKPGVGRSFVPKTFDNHLDVEPVTVEISSPTESEKRALLRLLRASFAFDDDGAVTETKAASEDAWIRQAITAHVVAVKNYSGAAGPITNAAAMLEHGEYALLIDVANEILSAASLTEGEIKNSGGSSGSSNPATQEAS